jgi:hypothetical protein
LVPVGENLLPVDSVHSSSTTTLTWAALAREGSNRTGPLGEGSKWAGQGKRKGKKGKEKKGSGPMRADGLCRRK